jgi:hypothetical protein
MNITLITATLVAAHLSLQFVERPVRKDRQGFWTRTRLVIATVFLSGTFVAIGVAMHISDGFKNRYIIPDTVYDSMVTTSKQDACFGLKRLEEPKDWFCKLGKADEAPSIFVFGDSHVIHFLPAIETAARRAGVSLLATGLGSCAPLLGLYLPEEFGQKTNCHNTNRRVFEFIQHEGIEHVILIGRWELYTDGGYTGTKFRYLSQTANGPMNKDESRQAFIEGVKNTLSRYATLGITPHFFLQVPRQKYEILDLYRRYFDTESSDTHSYAVSISEHEALQSFNRRIFTELGAQAHDFSEALCTKERCPFGTPESSFYFDDNHLSLTGSKKLAESVNEALNMILNGSKP